MKLVFSRKGFDSSAGGFPSPIINGKPISFPIPYPGSNKTYQHYNLGKIVNDLTLGKLAETNPCHNDPDLKMGAFGQVSSAQSHLNNQNVGSGDLFLFFGWMFVDQELEVGLETDDFNRKYPKYATHPHAIGNWTFNNTIYIAPQTFSLFEEFTIRGFVNFSISNRFMLTDDNAPSKRFWNVPDWLDPKKGGCIPSYHDERNYIDGFLKTAGRGQEFLCHLGQTKSFRKWLLDLFSEEIHNPNKSQC